MECVAFEYVLDFELERPTSAKSLEIKNLLPTKEKLFVALPTYGYNNEMFVECLWIWCDIRITNIGFA